MELSTFTNASVGALSDSTYSSFSSRESYEEKKSSHSRYNVFKNTATKIRNNGYFISTSSEDSTTSDSSIENNGINGGVDDEELGIPEAPILLSVDELISGKHSTLASRRPRWQQERQLLLSLRRSSESETMQRERNSKRRQSFIKRYIKKSSSEEGKTNSSIELEHSKVSKNMRTPTTISLLQTVLQTHNSTSKEIQKVNPDMRLYSDNKNNKMENEFDKRKDRSNRFKPLLYSRNSKRLGVLPRLYFFSKKILTEKRKH